MALNVTTAVFVENCNTATASPSLAQWDTEQVLKISGIELPDSYKAEFSTVYTQNAIPAIGDASGVKIPNELLQRSAPITAYIVLYGENGGRNREYWITIYITPGQPPETITPDPEQADVIDEAIAALNNGVARTEAAATSAEGSARDAEAAAVAVQNLSVAAETLATGEPATVEKTVDEETGAVTLNFGLPRGAKGDPLTYEELTPEQKAELVQGPILEAQDAAVDAVGSAGTTQVNAVNQAGTTQTGAVNNAGANQVAAVNQAGTNQVQAVEDKGAEVLEHIPPDYTDLVNDVADLSRQLSDETTGLDSKAPVILETVSGAIASFDDGANGMPIKKLVAQIEPVQDLHGYENPWPAGGGKNLLPSNTLSSTQNGVTYTVQSDGSVIANGTATEDSSFIYFSKSNYGGNLLLSNGSYILSGAPSGSSSSTYRITTNGFGGINDYGNGVSFNITSELAQTNVVLFVKSGVTVTNLAFYPMIRLATETDATFAPYSNICPISGWTGAEITQRGVNIWDEEWEPGIISAVTGNNADSTSYSRTKNYIPINPNAKYYASITSIIYIRMYDRDKNYLGFSQFTSSSAFTPAILGPVFRDAYYMRIVWDGQTYNNNISINYPATDTTYHPYTGDQISVTFPTTIYYAEANAISGELADYGYFATFDGSEAWYTTGTDGKFYLANFLPNQGYVGDLDAISSIAIKEISSNLLKGTFAVRAFDNGNAWIGFAMNPTEFPDVATFKSFLSTLHSAGTPVTVAVKKKTKTDYQLPGIELNTLYGQNNIWADTGDVEVTYPADTKLYIDGKIAEMQATILENIGG